MLSTTDRIMVGPIVTNPLTRDTSVTASLFTTLNDMFGKRTICGIGHGDSARRVLGKKPATLTHVEESIRLIKDLTEGREADIGGNEVHLPWVENGRLDVGMAGYDPKALTLAGRIADGFILQLAGPYLLEWSMRYVRLPNPMMLSVFPVIPTP